MRTSGPSLAEATFLADFLEQIDCDKLFLVGDMLDGWRLRKNWYWDSNHDRVVRAILKHAKRGTQIVYIPGNHDEMFRAWLPSAQTLTSWRSPASRCDARPPTKRRSACAC